MKLILIILYAYILTPFIKLDFLYRPETTGVNFYFRIMTELLFGAAIYLILKRQKIKLKPSPILIAAGAAVLIALISTFYSRDWTLSFMGDYQRMEGVVTWIHLFALLAVISTSTISWYQWNRLFTVMVTVSGIICLKNLYDFLASDNDRVYSIISNSAFLANYLTVHLFICLILIFKGGKRWKILFSVIASLHLLTIILAGTRSVILALALAFVFISAISLSGIMSKAARWLKGYSSKRIALSALISAVILSFAVLSAVYTATKYFYNDKIISTEYKASTNRLFEYRLSDQTINLRLALWRIGLRGAARHLWTGVGPEQFNRVYFKNFDPSLANKDPWYDRPHNSYIYCLLSIGIFGLIAFVAVFTAAFLCCMKIPVSSERFILSALIVYFFCQGFFIFNHITALIPFVIILGYMVQRSCRPLKIIKLKIPISAPAAGLLAATVLTTLSILACNTAMFLTCYRIKAAFGINEKPSLENLEKCKAAFRCPPAWRRNALENSIWFYARNFFDSENSPFKQNYLDTITEYIQKDTAQYPGDARHQVFYASFFRKVNEPQKAIYHLEKALAACPNHPEIITELGRTFCLMNDFASAKRCFIKAKQLCPVYKPATDALKLFSGK